MLLLILFRVSQVVSARAFCCCYLLQKGEVIAKFLKDANMLPGGSVRSNAIVIGTDLADIQLGNDLHPIDTRINVG